MGKQSCFQKQKMRKGLWSPEEDEKLLKHLARNSHTSWSSVPKLAGLQRCGKSCRLRWINYLRPDLKRGTFSQDEEDLIIKLHAALGNRWSQIAAQLPGRTDNEIKNLWNSCIKKKLRQKGIDPNTHMPLSDNKQTELESAALEKDSTRNCIDNYSMSSLSCSTSNMTLSMSANQLLWLNQSNREFGMNSELSCNSMDLKAVADLPFWEDCNPSSSGSKNSSFLNGGLCAWPDLSTERGNKYQLLAENEEMKWSECLQVNFPISSPPCCQSQPLHNGELKEGSYFDMENLNLCFQNH